MTKNTLSALVSIVTASAVENKDAILAELNKELNRGADKAAQKMAEYDAAWEVVNAVFAQTSNTLTVAELMEACEDTLPEGFTKGKLSYALTHYWADRVVKVEGKTNAYRKA